MKLFHIVQQFTAFDGVQVLFRIGIVKTVENAGNPEHIAHHIGIVVKWHHDCDIAKPICVIQHFPANLMISAENHKGTVRMMLSQGQTLIDTMI